MKDEEYAGFWIRVGANLIDLIILLVSFSVLAGLFMFVFSDMLFGPMYSQGGLIYHRQAFAFFELFEILFKYVVPFILTIWFWLKFQATPGKMATNLRLVDALTGDTLSKGQAIGRYFATFLSLIPFGLGYLWIAFDRRNQSWHDKLAGTVVIRSRHVEKVAFDKPKKEVKS